MSYNRGKGGKVLGEGRGDQYQGAREESSDQVTFPARAFRETYRGIQGAGRQPEKPCGAKPKKRFSCSTCQDLCCGLARELVATAFGLGKVTMSPKVIIVVVCNWDLV